ncbi:MAG: MCE family protein [Solirubrobacterales bacterium]|nr:MCE family protein [Solirubrobacterales bacterium]
MRGRGSGGIAGNPVLIGAATTLVIIVAVFLAYNANQGLPFVPTYQLKVDVPSGANLVRGNEVRVGGARVGTVDRIEARRRPDGTNFARLVLKLDKAVDPLPRDSKIAIRSKSALGLKYAEITRGESSRGFADGETMPLSASAPNQVEFDEVINTFDDRTRAGIQGSLDGFGTALAGRGAGLNAAIGAFRPLLGNVIPVAQNLSSRSTDLRGLVRGLSRAAAEVGPVAQTQADLFSNLDTTFTALNQVARPYIQDSISEGAPALDAAVRSFKVQQPFLRNTAGLFADLRPGARALRTAAPDLSEALRVGTPTLLRAPALNRRLEPVFTTLQAFAEDPAVPRAIRRLSETARTLRPTLEYLAPAQTTCNYVSLFFRNIASVVSEGDANGTWQRFIIVATPAGPNNEGLASAKPADGPTEANHLHSNPYPNTAAPGQPKECESGNEVYLRGRTTIGNVPGTQSATTEVIP